MSIVILSELGGIFRGSRPLRHTNCDRYYRHLGANRPPSDELPPNYVDGDADRRTVGSPPAIAFRSIRGMCERRWTVDP
jgi:hypothetical protein